jgi:uncharacterized coiled-coil protein SlyX
LAFCVIYFLLSSKYNEKQKAEIEELQKRLDVQKKECERLAAKLAATDQKPFVDITSEPAATPAHPHHDLGCAPAQSMPRPLLDIEMSSKPLITLNKSSVQGKNNPSQQSDGWFPFGNRDDQLKRGRKNFQQGGEDWTVPSTKSNSSAQMLPPEVSAPATARGQRHPSASSLGHNEPVHTCTTASDGGEQTRELQKLVDKLKKENDSKCEQFSGTPIVKLKKIFLTKFFSCFMLVFLL